MIHWCACWCVRAWAYDCWLHPCCMNHSRSTLASLADLDTQSFDRFWINIWDTKSGYAKSDDETASWSHGTQIVKNKFCCMGDTCARGSSVCTVLHKTTCHVYLTCLERLPTYFWLENLQLSSCTLLTRSEKDDVIKRTSRPLFDGNVASTTFVSFHFLLVLSNRPLHNE